MIMYIKIFNEIMSLLMRGDLCHPRGMVEFWNNGIMGTKSEKTIFDCLSSFKPIIPSFQYSINRNCETKWS